MAITLVDSTATGNATNTSSRTIAVPAGVANKTVVIIDVGIFSAGAPTGVTITGGAGSASFAQYAQGITGSDQVRSFWKRLDAADTGNYTITITGGSGHWLDATAVAYAGVVETGNPYEDVDTATNNAANAPSVTSTVTTNGSILHWHAYNANPAVSHTPPTGPAAFTELEDFDCGTVAWLSNPSTGSNVISGATESGGSAGIHVVVATVLKPEATGPDPDDPGYGYLLTGSGNRLIVDGGTGKLLLGTDELPPSGTNHTAGETANEGLTETTTLQQGHGKAQTDNLGLTDVTRTVAQTHSQNPLDAMGITETTSVQITKAVSQTDNEGLTETTSLFQGHASNPLDPEGLTETTTLVVGHARNPVETLGITDAAVAASMQMPVSATETLGLTDTPSVVLIPASPTVVATDNLPLSDTAALAQGHASNQTDTESLTDAGVFSISRAATDSENLTDSAAVALTDVEIRTDNLGLTDSSAVAQGSSLAQTDAMGLTDTAVVSLFKLLPVSAQDSEGLTDSSSLTMEYVRTVTDGVGLSDTVQAGQGHGRSTVDTVAATDSAVVSRGLAQNSVDPLGITDTFSASWVLALAAQDALGLSDTTAVVLGVLLAVAATDNLALTDTVVRQMALGLVRSDNMSMTDSVSRALTAVLVVSDPLDLADDVVPSLRSLVTVGDSMGMAEVVDVNVFGTTVPATIPTARFGGRLAGGRARLGGDRSGHTIGGERDGALGIAPRTSSLIDSERTGEQER